MRFNIATWQKTKKAPAATQATPAKWNGKWPATKVTKKKMSKVAAPTKSMTRNINPDMTDMGPAYKQAVNDQAATSRISRTIRRRMGKKA